MNILVFDIETIPDIETGKQLYDLDGLSDREVAEVMFTLRRQETGNSEFLRHHLHRIVTISLVLRTTGKLNIWSLGDINASEKEIVQRFYDGIERYTPMIVSWNGRGFDLPVLHYRALLYGISAPRYWETGDEDQTFRWNNYLNRFHERHTDLMDVLSGYEYRSIASLDEIATMLGYPGKMGMGGDKVWEYYLEGDVESIRNYCEIDVLNTYLIFLRYELMRGRQTEAGYEKECQRLRKTLTEENEPHFQKFLEAWK